MAQFLLLRQSAFTLLDLLVALGIFVVLAAIAIPNLGAQLPAYRLNSAARQVQSELHRVKSQAVARNTDFRLVLLTPSFYRIERKVTETTYEPTGEYKPLPDGITYGSATSVKSINLTSRGTATGGTVQLCNSRRESKSVIVSGSSGRIRIESGRC
jgi:type II secretory pathway pseudopilin PulG